MTLAELRESAQAELNEMLDPLDIPGSWTPRERERYATKRAVLQARIWTIDNSNRTLAEVATKIDADVRSLVDVESCRQMLCDELLALPALGRYSTTKEQGTRRNLELSIAICDRGRRAADDSGWALETLKIGDLLRALKYVAAPPTEGRAFGLLAWPGSIGEIQRRLKELEAKRADAQARLDAVLEESSVSV
jgi:hypothetical protein